MTETRNLNQCQGVDRHHEPHLQPNPALPRKVMDVDEGRDEDENDQGPEREGNEGGSPSEVDDDEGRVERDDVVDEGDDDEGQRKVDDDDEGGGESKPGHLLIHHKSWPLGSASHSYFLVPYLC